MSLDLHQLRKLQIVPCTLDEANAFVAEHHRHHDPMPGAKFCLAVAEDQRVCGVVIVGRPVGRMIDDGWTLEINRLCTDGSPNACSCLYRAAWRAARALGFRKLVTYTLPEEGGASLRGAGFRFVGQTSGGTWNRNGRPRIDTHPTQMKWKWELNTRQK